MDSFRTEFARRIGSDPESVDGILDMLSDYVWGQVEDEGRCHIPGLGSFYMVDGQRLFEPDPQLSRMVNHRYAGLDVLSVENTGSEVVIGDDYAGFSDDSFVPRWEETGFVDEDESVTPIDDAPEFEETRLAEGDVSGVGGEVSGDAASGSFLDIDAEDDELAVGPPAVPEPPSNVREEESVSVSETRAETPSEEAAMPADDTAPVIEADQAFAGVEDADDDAGVEGVVVPIDENAEPLVGKGRPKTPAWMYALPLIAVAFVVIAILWAELRTENPRPVRETNQEAVSGTPQSTEGGETVDGQLETGDAEINEVPAEPIWEAGAIDPSSREWTIVVSSKPTEAEAVQIATAMARQFTDASVPVDVLESRVNGRLRYRVAVGQFRSSAVTYREINRLSSQLPEGSWALRMTPNM